MMPETQAVPKNRRKLVIGAFVVAGGFFAYRVWKARQDQQRAATDQTQGIDSSQVTDTTGGAAATGGGYSTSPTQTAPQSNAEWTAKAVDLLTQQGWAGTDVQIALGRYLTDQVVTDDQANIIRAAIAEAGYPPEGYHTIHTGGTTTTAPTSGDSVPAAPGALRYGHLTKGGADIGWDAVTGATGYQIVVDGRGGSTLSARTGSVGGWKPGSTHHIQVRARNAVGWGPYSPTLTLTALTS